MIYSTGTISINGNTATGSGTNWTAPASQVRAGQTIIVMSNPVQLFQISSVNSATSMTVTPAASPALSGQKYAILVSDIISVDGLAQAMSQLIKEYDENIGAWETFATTSANQTITVTINGTTVTIPGIGKLAQKGSNGALAIADGGTGATNAADARTNLGLGDALIGDECKIAGFDSSNVNAPYMRFARTNTVVHLATKDYAQPKDQTLTDLSGKDKAELRTYLDLKSAAQRDVGSGANQIPDMNDFTSSLTSPGWQKLPSGLIIQWGTANPSSTGEIFITFPVAFSAYPMYVGFGPQQASLPNVVQSPVISAPTITNLGCGVRNLMIPTAGGVPVASMSSFFWIAVGK
ncbi:TPA: hypothetical protein HJO75_003238 [Escherichia coli]|nr:hypothetical protein [Escherichia coli]HAI4474175.1 hypothetical protein [Escherichia coli]HAJ7289891.1 hypothetical protein [Escherichia coli]HAJ8658676.1 hypothetical protein [Escherichia coli]HBA4197017.1 hypothetical protein [Escherichia coli]